MCKDAESNFKESFVDLMKVLGVDTDHPGFKNTPSRLISAYKEMLSGYFDSGDKHRTTFPVPTRTINDMVIVRDIQFVSMCMHHVLPFYGTVSVGYVIEEKDTSEIIGLSKIARIVDTYSKRLQTQEELASDIMLRLSSVISCKGIAVVIKATHTCMSCRGVKQAGAQAVVSALSGVFRDNNDTRAEFLSLIGGV